MPSVSLLFLLALQSVHGLNLEIALSSDDAIFGSTFRINISLAVQNQTIGQPSLEIDVPPQLSFTKGTVRFLVCPPSSECATGSESFGVQDGQLMGIFSLGNRVIDSTRSFGIPTGNDSIWQQGYVHQSVVQLENVSSTNVTDNRLFAIAVFRYWRNNDSSAVSSQRSVGKYFLIHPANISLSVTGQSVIMINRTEYESSLNSRLQVSAIATIDSRGGLVVLKLIIPAQLIIDKSGYGLGNDRVGLDSVMQRINADQNTFEFYVLITPDMLSTTSDNTATLTVVVITPSQTAPECQISASLLYGIYFQFHVDPQPISLIASGDFGDQNTTTGPPRLPTRLFIDLAPKKVA